MTDVYDISDIVKDSMSFANKWAFLEDQEYDDVVAYFKSKDVDINQILEDMSSFHEIAIEDIAEELFPQFIEELTEAYDESDLTLIKEFIQLYWNEEEPYFIYLDDHADEIVLAKLHLPTEWKQYYAKSP